MSGDVPELSVVLATGHPWPEAEPTLRALRAAALPRGVEVFLCDGHGSGAPPEDERDRWLTVIAAPGESVFELRARGLALARGRIVVITEDHCLPDPDWPRELLAAHERHPDAVAIAGSVANGETDSAWDWANFLMNFADHMRPVPGAATVRAPSVANGSVKRELAGIPARPEPGWLELGLLPALVGAGKVALDGGPRVVHVQSHGGALANLAAHFHNGRASAGLRVGRPGPRAVRTEARRLAALPLRLRRELHEALAVRPPLDGPAARGARLVPVLAVAHAVGELAGLLAGPGTSADRLD